MCAETKGGFGHKFPVSLDRKREIPEFGLKSLRVDQVRTSEDSTNIYIQTDEMDIVKKEALHQYIIIRKLHKELQEERDASATAASEALSMILRLQREKALEKMEACQYRRMAEKKLQHAQQCLIALEEIMHEKEFEISKLKHQIRLYKTKLLSNGLNDFDVGDVETCEDLSSCHDVTLPACSLHGHARRHISLSPLVLGRLNSEIDSNGSSHLLPSVQTVWRNICDWTDQFIIRNKQVSSLFQESTRRHYATGRNECKKNTSGSSFSSVEETSCSWYAALNGDALGPSKFGTGTRLEQWDTGNLASRAEEQMNTSEYATSSISHNAFQIARVHNIVEVSESEQYHYSNAPKEHLLDKSVIRTKTHLAAENLMPQEKELHIFRNNDYLDRTFAHSDHETGRILPHGLENLKCQLPQIDYGKMVEMDDSDRSNEHSKMTSDIYEQLNTIEYHLKNSESTRHPMCESHIASVMEVNL